MPTSASAHRSSSSLSNRAPTPTSSFHPIVPKSTPPVYNKDIDEELLKKAMADRLQIQRAAAREKRKNTCFATITDNTASAAQWRSNSIARVNHDQEKMNRYLHSFVPVGTLHPNSEVRKSVEQEQTTKFLRNKLTNSFEISYEEQSSVVNDKSSISQQRHAGVKNVVAPAKKVVIKQNESAVSQIFREASSASRNSNYSDLNTTAQPMMDFTSHHHHHQNNNSNNTIEDLSRITNTTPKPFQQYHHNQQQHQNNNSNIRRRPSLFSNNSSTSQNTYKVTTVPEDAEYFESEIDSFEEKLAQLRRQEKEREEEEKQQVKMGLKAASNKRSSSSSNAVTSTSSAVMRKLQQQQQQSGNNINKSNTNNSHRKTTSASDCAPFALPKVLQMLFRLLLSRKLSATAALRAVGFPELRSRLSAAAEGGMLKRHAFEAIFLDCLRTDQERLEHAAVVDCFLLDAGGDAELAFVLIALQVLLGIASAADVMRYCFYLLDTSSRVPRYLTRLELEALLREADSAAADNPASKNDSEYQSMRLAVMKILDPASELFDGKGRMPLSGFLERLRVAMNELNNNNNNSQNNNSGGGGVVDEVEKTISLQSQKHKKRSQQQQQLDGLASKHDLFHHSTSRRIVLQTAPEELVKET